MAAPVIAGTIVALAFFIGLGAWAAVAPLQSAAIAPGIVVVESSRKTLNHLEGGIVAEIHAREGQRVAATQLLKLPAASRIAAAVINGWPEAPSSPLQG